jgi:hypothetical protein
MQERALFSNPERAVDICMAIGKLSDRIVAQPVTQRGQRIGYEAWYQDKDGIMTPVYENEV